MTNDDRKKCLGIISMNFEANSIGLFFFLKASSILWDVFSKSSLIISCVNYYSGTYAAVEEISEGC